MVVPQSNLRHERGRNAPKYPRKPKAADLLAAGQLGGPPICFLLDHTAQERLGHRRRTATAGLFQETGLRAGEARKSLSLPVSVMPSDLTGLRNGVVSANIVSSAPGFNERQGLCERHKSEADPNYPDARRRPAHSTGCIPSTQLRAPMIPANPVAIWIYISSMVYRLLWCEHSPSLCDIDAIGAMDPSSDRKA